MKINTIYLRLLVVVFLLYGCHSTKEINDETTGIENNHGGDMLAGNWSLLSINNEKIDSGLFEKGAPTINFDEENKKVSGYSGCNNYQGSYSIEGSKIIVFSQFASTRMACPEMSVEGKMQEFLSGNKLSFKIDFTSLILSNSENQTILFEKAD
jgi:heat shock protein HslJ